MKYAMRSDDLGYQKQLVDWLTHSRADWQMDASLNEKIIRETTTSITKSVAAGEKMQSTFLGSEFGVLENSIECNATRWPTRNGYK